MKLYVLTNVVLRIYFAVCFVSRINECFLDTVVTTDSSLAFVVSFVQYITN